MKGHKENQQTQPQKNYKGGDKITKAFIKYLKQVMVSFFCFSLFIFFFLLFFK